MTDQVRVLLMNPDGYPGYRHVTDDPSDSVMAMFGVDGDIDRVVPFAMSPDLSRFRRFYDRRVTPPGRKSIYRRPAAELSASGLYGRVMGAEGRWVVAALFQHSDPAVASVLADMRAAAVSGDAVYALGAILLAVAYRRWLLQGGGV